MIWTILSSMLETFVLTVAIIAALVALYLLASVAGAGFETGRRRSAERAADAQRRDMEHNR